MRLYCHLPLIIDSRLRVNPFAIRVLHFLNFTHRIRQLDHLGMDVSTRQNQMHQRRLALNDFQNLFQVHEPKMQGIVDFIQDEDILLA